MYFLLRRLDIASTDDSLAPAPNALHCTHSTLTIGCTSGSCWGTPSAGEYGYYPGKRNDISIDGKKFSWIGEIPVNIQLKIWRLLKDGSRFAYQLVHWPYEGIKTGTETIAIPKGLKDKIYRMSLVKP